MKLNTSLFIIRLITILSIFSTSFLYPQSLNKKVLFLGNSYTYFNSMPLMVQKLASSTSDSLKWEMHAPGGYYLYDHWVSPTSIEKIKLGGWDYVVLQEQSQAPALPDYQIQGFFMYAHKLDSVIKQYNQCATTLFYMTWGRKNGDSLYYQIYYPWYKEPTYDFMDSLISQRYIQTAQEEKAEISPVGAVWKYLRTNNPGVELYQADESHPSKIGSYTAALCFYSSIFRKDPTLTSYNSGLSSSEATVVKMAVKNIVYDSLMKWNIGKYDSLKASNCIYANIIKMTSINHFKVFPNPLRDYFIVSLKNQINKSYKITVFNETGKIVLDQHFYGSSKKLDFSAFKPGVYVVQCMNEESGMIYSHKLLKLSGN